MTTKTEGKHAGHFIVSEAPGHLSREQVTIAQGQVLEAGSVVGKLASNGKYVGYDNDGTDGEDTASGILYASVDATDGDVEATIIARNAEVNRDELVWDDANDTPDREAAEVDLNALHIVLR